MASLDADQLTDMRADLGVGAAGSSNEVFTDVELQRLYTRSEGDYNAAVTLGFRQILAQANKLHSYRIAQSSEDLQQVRQNIRDMLAYWEGNVDRSDSQIAMAGIRRVPRRHKDLPSTHPSRLAEEDTSA